MSGIQHAEAATLDQLDRTLQVLEEYLDEHFSPDGQVKGASASDVYDLKVNGQDSFEGADLSLTGEVTWEIAGEISNCRIDAAFGNTIYTILDQVSGNGSAVIDFVREYPDNGVDNVNLVCTRGDGATVNDKVYTRFDTTIAPYTAYKAGEAFHVREAVAHEWAFGKCLEHAADYDEPVSCIWNGEYFYEEEGGAPVPVDTNNEQPSEQDGSSSSSGGEVTYPTGLTLLELSDNSLLRNRYYSSPGVSQYTEEGAVNEKNKGWQLGTESDYNIESQQYGERAIVAGLHRNNFTYLERGVTALSWGIDQQASDGSFPGTRDAFHQVTSFLGALSRSASLLQLGNKEDSYSSFIDAAESSADKGVAWLMKSSVKQIGDKNNERFAHRRWMLAALLTEVGQREDNATYLSRGEAYAKEGLNLQHSSGYNPEIGGYDSNYQNASIVNGAYYYLLTGDREVKSWLRDSLDWSLSRLNDDGSPNLDGNTRVYCGTDQLDTSGTYKKFDYRTAVYAFVYGYQIFKDQKYLDAAEKLADFDLSRPDLCPEEEAPSTEVDTTTTTPGTDVTNDDYASRIAALRQRISELRRLIQLKRGGSPQATGNADTTTQLSSTDSMCPYTWTRNLRLGDRGDDVLSLQKFLNEDVATQVAGTYGPSESETNYYGFATFRAVSTFQEKYRQDVLVPAGLSSGNGYFGTQTRAKANSLCQ